MVVYSVRDRVIDTPPPKHVARHGTIMKLPIIALPRPQRHSTPTPVLEIGTLIGVNIFVYKIVPPVPYPAGVSSTRVIVRYIPPSLHVAVMNYQV